MFGELSISLIYCKKQKALFCKQKTKIISIIAQNCLDLKTSISNVALEQQVLDGAFGHLCVKNTPGYMETVGIYDSGQLC